MADSCPAPAPRQEESRFRRIAREYFESPLATIALVVFCIILLAALFAPWISPQNPYDPLEINFMDARLAPGSHASESDMTYWLGTDAQGRDMVSSIEAARARASFFFILSSSNSSCFEAGFLAT